MKKAIVTGANGFIGRWLIDKLIDENVEVIAIVRNETSELNIITDKLKIIRCELDSISDLDDLINDRNIDVFYHLAWEGNSGENRADYSLQLNNVKYACDCAVVAKKIGCKKFIGIGTITEKVAENILNMPSRPQNMIYGLAKHITHSMLHVICNDINLPYVWAQLSNVYGIDNDTGNIINYTLSELQNDNRPIFSTAEQPYDLMSVKDTAEALFLLGEKNTSQNQYFIGSGEPKILSEYLLSIGRIYGDESMIGLGERPDDGLKYDIGWFDTSALTLDTGFMPKKSFVENMEDIINSKSYGGDDK